jgi:hypothetical protein
MQGMVHDGSRSATKEQMMFEEEKREIDKLYEESKKEINNPETLEFYMFLKLDKIIDLLSRNEQLTLEYLSSASPDFFTFLFTKNTDTAETILEKLPSEKVAEQIVELGEKYKTDDEQFEFAIAQAKNYLSKER